MAQAAKVPVKQSGLLAPLMLGYGIYNDWKASMPTPTPNWQPLSKFPLIAHLIDGALTDNQAQFRCNAFQRLPKFVTIPDCRASRKPIYAGEHGITSFRFSIDWAG